MPARINFWFNHHPLSKIRPHFLLPGPWPDGESAAQRCGWQSSRVVPCEYNVGAGWAAAKMEGTYPWTFGQLRPADAQACGSLLPTYYLKTTASNILLENPFFKNWRWPRQHLRKLPKSNELRPRTQSSPLSVICRSVPGALDVPQNCVPPLGINGEQCMGILKIHLPAQPAKNRRQDFLTCHCVPEAEAPCPSVCMMRNRWCLCISLPFGQVGMLVAVRWLLSPAHASHAWNYTPKQVPSPIPSPPCGSDPFRRGNCGANASSWRRYAIASTRTAGGAERVPDPDKKQKATSCFWERSDVHDSKCRFLVSMLHLLLGNGARNRPG